jgi:hypothetical protein
LLTSHSKQGISNPGMEAKAEETLKPSEAGLREGTPTDIPTISRRGELAWIALAWSDRPEPNMHGRLRAVLNQGKVWELVGTNPAQGVRLPARKHASLLLYSQSKIFAV